MKRLPYIVLALGALWGLVGYLATVPIVGYHPHWRQLRARPDDFGLKAEEVAFPSLDGIPLRGWYIPALGVARGAVILVHGIDGNRSDMLPRASFLVRDPYNTLLIDLRGHGESGGDYAAPDYLEALDILGAVAYLRSRGQRALIVVLGHSYGAVAALYAAAQSPDIAAVIADSPYISFADMRSRATTLLANDPEKSFWARLGLRLADSRAAELVVLPIFYLRTGVWVDTRRADALLTIPRIGRRPILFISGTRDAIAPPENARRMYDAALGPDKSLLIVPDATHDSTYETDRQRYEYTVKHFLGKVLETSSTQVGHRLVTRDGRSLTRLKPIARRRQRRCLRTMPTRFGQYV